jgi:hypothetical protein
MLKDSFVLTLDHDGLMEILQGKSFGVVVAVFGLGDVFGHKSMRQVAIHAGCRPVVARLLPRIVLGIHNVAVGARLGIGAEIGEPFRIPEREGTGSHQHGHKKGQNDHLFFQHPHPLAYASLSGHQYPRIPLTIHTILKVHENSYSWKKKNNRTGSHPESLATFSTKVWCGLLRLR